MTKCQIKPKMGEAKILIAEVLDADMKYRRELGSFGADDHRTKIRAHMLDHTMGTLRWWYATRFPSGVGETAPQQEG